MPDRGDAGHNRPAPAPSVAAGTILSRIDIAGAGHPNMRIMATLCVPSNQRWPAALLAGFHASWLTILLIVAINAGFAGLMSIEDERPLWHPLVSTQCFGLCIAYAVNAASPWERGSTTCSSAVRPS